ncbi:winged helix-turn-helix transcriptional regulator [Actinoplanes sp. TBRC 11911]|nr:winged helix-turn-helix transcriptional regulator [Actinoplanes sp. TBRC 11911]
MMRNVDIDVSRQSLWERADGPTHARESETLSTDERQPEPADPGLTPDEEAASWEFIRALSALPRVIDAEVERVTGLKVSEYGVLIAVSGSTFRGVRPSDLAGGAQMTASALTRLVDRLTKLGLTARQPSETDRRSHNVVLTAAGRRMLETSRVAYHECLRRVVLDNLHGADLTRLTVALQAMGSRATDRPGGASAARRWPTPREAQRAMALDSWTSE